MGRDFSFKDRPLEGDRCSGSAVAVAAATHHSLVVTSKGHLYAFGLGKGGRLGTGNENHCPLPVRILGALEKRQVVAVSAAENHSLCVTSDGSVFAWGQNGFGQLGIPKTASSSASSEQKFLPQRVEALRQSFMVMVAAGDRHSMALSRNGEVYTWGKTHSSFFA
jgi:alpha-tubulin suppressor-like RCC1 family protein